MTTSIEVSVKHPWGLEVTEALVAVQVSEEICLLSCLNVGRLVNECERVVYCDKYVCLSVCLPAQL